MPEERNEKENVHARNSNTNCEPASILSSQWTVGHKHVGRHSDDG
jgi:hypothetical protein